ncbi:MAG: ABC transporter ATP-binding protein [Firmicutes bacterium]|nr:ABC transporter ATP-binding protein [Bacillota bacterium]
MLEVNIKRALPGFTLDISLTVNEEIVSILGPSGSGKTMTLFCIAGLVRPDAGLIKLNNRIIYSSADQIFIAPRNRKIGFVFQNYALFPHLTVAENIAYGLAGQPKPTVSKKVAELLEVINIPALKDRYPAELSSGQQQRVALARAIAPEPEALLLDEPFSALDTYRKERMEYELLSLYRYYRGDILFVTHDLEQGFKLGKQIAVYDNGKIVQYADKYTVISNPVNRTAARLSGFKNLIEGRVVACSVDEATVFIPEFEQTLMVNFPKSLKLNTDQPVIIGIRPEHLTAVSQPKHNSVGCRLDRKVRGVTTLHSYYYALADQQNRYSLECLDPQTFLDHQDHLQDTCYIHFNPQHLVIIPLD